MTRERDPDPTPGSADAQHGAPSAEELLRHAGFLSSLARAMTRNEQDAEDLVQETWLNALAGATKRRGALRHWLAAIARNRARSNARREILRAPREHGREREREGNPTSDDDPAIIARDLEERRIVLAAVLALPEPYLTAIRLRHFEGLAPVEIGRRIGVPTETARSRVQRGHELLRAKLERHFGSRQALFLVLGRWERDAATAPASLGATVLGPLGAALLAVACGVPLLAWMVLRTPAGVGVDPGVASTAGAPADVVRTGAGEGPPREDLAAPGDESPLVAAAAPPAAAPAGPPAAAAVDAMQHHVAVRRLHARVLAPDGRPVEGARLLYAAVGVQDLGTTDEDGRIVADVRAGALRRGTEVGYAPFPLHVVARGYQAAVVPRLHEHFPEEETAPVVLELTLPGPARHLRGKLETHDGSSPEDWRVAIRNPTAGHGREPHVTLEELGSGAPLVLAPDRTGRFELEGLFDRPYDLIAWHPETLAHTLLTGLEPDLDGLVVRVGEDRGARRIAGRLASRSGAPVVGARLYPALLTTNDGLRPFTYETWTRGEPATTDGAGRFELRHPHTLPLRLIVEGAMTVIAADFLDLAEDAPAEELELSMPVRCEVVVEISAHPPAQRIAFLDADQERTWIRVDDQHAAMLGGIPGWPGLMLWPGPEARTLWVSEDAKYVRLHDWNADDDVELRELELDPTQRTVLRW